VPRTPHIAHPGYFSRGQACEYLGLPGTTFRQLIDKYGVPSIKEKGSLIYKIEDIEALARVYADERR
jgi:hypothetical protein